MGRDDARSLLKAACSIAAILATAVLVGHHVEPQGSVALWWDAHWQLIRHCALSRKNIAVEIQAVGALIAFYGLLRAYVRARYRQSVSERIVRWIKIVWGRLLHLPQTITLTGIPPARNFGRMGVTQSPPPHSVDITQSLHEQIRHLAQYVNDRTGETSKMAIDITELKLGFDGLKDSMSDLASEMREHTTNEIHSFNKQLDSTQALDLGWAIVGLLISFAGTVWGYGA
ncbi:hypothetical protein A5739_11370 [Mycobacterium colombiense]|uniref:hypothetical protein n=1 Tax=Mycobacterium colombiense TaxID=339268 RepID=UPI00096EC20C|nr:hypothetical protein [Mycobacterium colombiense]OMC32012.1 hypothetical protein A5739_11370 [Mycobacterium colombiense]